MDASASPPTPSIEKEENLRDILSSPPSILPIKTCPKCEDIVKNFNSSSIHFTLAYSRCRCHRSWKYSMPQTTAGNTTRCMSAAAIATSTRRNSYPAAGPSPLLKGGRTFLKPISIPPSSTAWSNDKDDGHLVKRSYYMQSTKSSATRRTQLLPPITLNPMKPILELTTTTTARQSLQNTNPVRINITETNSSSLFSNTSSTSSTKQVTFADQKKQTTRITKQGHHDLSSSSLIPSLPKIQNNSFHGNTIIQTTSPSLLKRTHSSTSSGGDSDGSTCSCTSDDDEQENETSNQPPVTTVAISGETIKNFEFVDLVKYVSSQQKIIASDLFDILDRNGDGHLSFSELLSGLTDSWQNVSSVLKLEHYLKPLYHVLGDETYFSKRDFVLCYALTQLFKDRNTSIPYLANVDKQFYMTIIKPLLMILIAPSSSISKRREIVTDYCKLINSHHHYYAEDTHHMISLQTIEAAVKDLNDARNQLSFNSKTANKLKKHTNGFTLLEILVFAPYIITNHK